MDRKQIGLAGTTKDVLSELNPKIRQRLENEYFVWLTTVGTNLAPQPRPVGFIWEQDSFVIYSRPQAHKLQHINQHPKVALHFNADISADRDVLVFNGEASIDHSVPPAYKNPTYMKKYRTAFASWKMTPEEFSREYSIAIRVKPSSFREE
jgi:PPOX class probable F420-dependent enzyme